ncbi:MAG: hypothetical protein JNL97_12705, partial [Verrucomicrobiales bacterium]|nr:hypothetical protein [Verrucomicrobiales bacterium]
MLTYVATPPAGVASTTVWQGTASFDGAEIPVTGVVRVGVGDESTVPRIRGSQRQGKVKVSFAVDAVTDQVLVIEASDDLRHWRDVGTAVHTGGVIEVTDDAAEGSTQRYYRLRPLGQ